MSSPGLTFGQVLTTEQWNTYLLTSNVQFGQVYTAAQWNAFLAGPAVTGLVPVPDETIAGDTGPPYPRYTPGAAPGDNAIGRFVIGVSPIGTIPVFDPWATIISQYANSPILTRLITNFNAYIDKTQNIDSFFDLIWNVDTAIGYGLDVWGRIVGVSRTLAVANLNEFLVFAESTELGSFGEFPFYAGAPLTDNFVLTDAAFRTLIFAKALANISDGSIASINQLLLNLFPGRGNCYVVDGLDMTMTYTFAFALSPAENAIVQSSGVLPKPVGVTKIVSAP